MKRALLAVLGILVLCLAACGNTSAGSSSAAPGAGAEPAAAVGDALSRTGSTIGGIGSTGAPRLDGPDKGAKAAQSPGESSQPPSNQPTSSGPRSDATRTQQGPTPSPTDLR